MTTIDQEARTLYEAGQSVRPDWDQLGETTKEVWREYTLAYWEARVPLGCVELFVPEWVWKALL